MGSVGVRSMDRLDGSALQEVHWQPCEAEGRPGRLVVRQTKILTNRDQ